jgi:hypothetical protein
VPKTATTTNTRPIPHPAPGRGRRLATQDLPAGARAVCGTCRLRLSGLADSKCRACHAEANREWRARNPEAVAAYNEARRIGPRQARCVACGASFRAGQRGPVSDRCPNCRRTRKLEQRRERPSQGR